MKFLGFISLAAFGLGVLKIIRIILSVYDEADIYAQKAFIYFVISFVVLVIMEFKERKEE
ncbi:hypothetical protein ACFL13_01225 [Patescibacteria group bacterium]